MSSNGTPQSYLSNVRNTNDNNRDRSMEQSNTNSGNPNGYVPQAPQNRYIPPTFDPNTGSWNTNGGSYQLPTAYGQNGQPINNGASFQPNFNFNWQGNGNAAPPSTSPTTGSAVATTPPAQAAAGGQQSRFLPTGGSGIAPVANQQAPSQIPQAAMPQTNSAITTAPQTRTIPTGTGGMNGFSNAQVPVTGASNPAANPYGLPQSTSNFAPVTQAANAQQATNNPVTAASPWMPQLFGFGGNGNGNYNNTQIN